jgi:sphingolipid delta-4 desaturase
MGYHNEHHDFPTIPWNNLPRLRALAPEYYDTLKYHPSWSGLLFQFIFDPEYTLFCRVERTRDRERHASAERPREAPLAELASHS